MPMYDLLNGPIMWTTFTLFAAGMVFKTISLVRLACACQPGTVFANPNARFSRSYKSSLPGRYPVTTLISVVFHLILLLLPLFITGHNILLDVSWGISLPMLPDHFADNLTVICLGCVFFFLFRRLLIKRVRAISFFSDYLIIALVILPFLTGFIAYHRLLPYNAILNAHIITGQLMLVAIPYTRLVHMIAFFVVRLAKPVQMPQQFEKKREGCVTMGPVKEKIDNKGSCAINSTHQKVDPAKVDPAKVDPAKVDPAKVDPAVIMAMLKQHAPQIKLFFSACIHCTYCADTCFLQKNNPDDPSYMPSYKVIHSVGRFYKKRGKVSAKALEQIQDLLWNKCALCTRCVCPLQLNIPEMIALGRDICRSQGGSPRFDDPVPPVEQSLENHGVVK